jgi:hypothetical protein
LISSDQPALCEPFRVFGGTTIDALLAFVAHHTEGLGAVGFTLAVLAAAPFFLFRPPGGQRG